MSKTELDAWLTEFKCKESRSSLLNNDYGTIEVKLIIPYNAPAGYFESLGVLKQAFINQNKNFNVRLVVTEKEGEYSMKLELGEDDKNE